MIGINNFCLGDFARLAHLQKTLGERMLIMACDFAPTEPQAYFRELFRHVDPQGLIVASFISPMFALDNGKYQVLQRDAEQLTRQVQDAMRTEMLSALAA